MNFRLLRSRCCPARRGTGMVAVIVLAGILFLGGAALAQDVEDVFGGLGEATRVEEGEEEAEAAEVTGEGSIFGRVFDGDTGAPVEGATVILKFPPPPAGEKPRQEVRISNPAGEFEFSGVPAGTYSINYIKSGYRAATMTDFQLQAGEAGRADFPLPPISAGDAGQVLDLEEFVAEAAVVGDMMSALEVRMESDQLLDIMSAEDLSKFASSDVADALRRVAGVNVVEGQFAIIRGLEDRYSSTLYNSAPVPSPDPDRQSVQLDLFPAEVVDNLVIAKTFAPPSPSNSSGGSIDIISHGYPEEFSFRVKAKGGFNTNVLDKFLEYDDGSPIGNKISDFWEPLDREFGGFLGGREEFAGREVRYKFLGNWEAEYGTAKGYQENLEPRTRLANPPFGDLGGGNGILSLTEGRFDFTESDDEEQWTGFAAAGVDLDRAGDHKLDASVFWTRKDENIVQLRENGFLRGFDYDEAYANLDAGVGATFENTFDGTFPGSPGNAALSSWIAQTGRRLGPEQSPTQGPLWFGSFIDSRSFRRDRDLLVPQLNGEHQISAVPGLSFNWSANYARTTQSEESLGARLWYEPCGVASTTSQLDCPDGVSPLTRDEYPDTFPVKVEDLAQLDDPNCRALREDGRIRGAGCGQWIGTNDIVSSANDIEERQWFGRFDGEYEAMVADWLAVDVRAGGWYERATRVVDSRFLARGLAQTNPICRFELGICLQDVVPVVFAGSRDDALDPLTSNGSGLRDLGRNLFQIAFTRDDAGDLTGTRQTDSDADRLIQAVHFGGKATFWDKLDFIGGFRYEDISIISNNDPFTGEFAIDLSPAIFPSKYLIFDRPDNGPGREKPDGSFTGPTQRPFPPFDFILNPPYSGREGFTTASPYNDELLGLRTKPGPCRDFALDLQPGIVGVVAVPIPGGTPAPGPGPGFEGVDCVDLADRSEIEEFVNGEIDEQKFLPSAGLAYRPIQGLTLRAAYSKTVARPSFREMAYYVSVEPGSDDVTVGNPQLQLTDVRSFDGRVEYVFGETGDLFAMSGFYKLIKRPIEAIVLRDQADFTSNRANFRTFFNNPNDAELWGIEVETRKNLGFLGPDFMGYFTIGGNFTYIDAEVDRTQAELDRSELFFEEGGSLPSSRRLFGQPEWIANADICFDHPGWGTKITLAFFAISDVLDAAGAANIGGGGQVVSATLDRYIDSFHTLDLVFSQRIWRGLDFRFTAKNLTDSVRQIVYDPVASSSRFTERSVRLGQDFSFQLSYDFTGFSF